MKTKNVGTISEKRGLIYPNYNLWSYWLGVGYNPTRHESNQMPSMTKAHWRSKIVMQACSGKQFHLQTAKCEEKYWDDFILC